MSYLSNTLPGLSQITPYKVHKYGQKTTTSESSESALHRVPSIVRGDPHINSHLRSRPHHDRYDSHTCVEQLVLMLNFYEYNTTVEGLI